MSTAYEKRRKARRRRQAQADPGLPGLLRRIRHGELPRYFILKNEKGRPAYSGEMQVMWYGRWKRRHYFVQKSTVLELRSGQ